MAAGPNFLLGYGERLTEPIVPPKRQVKKKVPYSFEEAKEQLIVHVQETTRQISQLPELACPDNKAVAIMTLHPEFIAKSYFPGKLLHSAGLDSVGSRPATVQPQKWTKNKSVEPTPTTELFIVGDRQKYSEWSILLPRWTEQTEGAEDLTKVELIRNIQYDDCVRSLVSDTPEPLLEVVLHASENSNSNFILEGFEAYVSQFSLKPDFERRFYAGGLCFFPLKANREVINEIAKFSFLRVVREMPILRPITSVARSAKGATMFACELPDGLAIDPDLRAAIFDGGMPSSSDLESWVDTYDADDSLTNPLPEGLQHGYNVSSALLFGPLEQGTATPQPFGNIDHYRVLDLNSLNDPDNLYDVLGRIQNVLRSIEYEFINISIGPQLPVEDDDVHAWTAVLDDLLSDGNILASIAVGNNGQLDIDSGNARIQVPSDCVNGLAVGAANSRGVSWTKANYSSIGPGRRPGYIKPDILAFGGSDKEAFWVPSLLHPGNATPTCGTSFASPLALRMGMGIRAHLGGLLRPLAIKTLLIHCCEYKQELARRDVGWGRISENLDNYLVCSDHAARVIYQGELTEAQYIRAKIPIPDQTLDGKVTIKATICIATETDPQDSGNYTRSGLDIIFRPHEDVLGEDGLTPKSDSFFQAREFCNEEELRQDAHKWETVLHKSKTKYGRSLKNPVFDIHYNARRGGHATGASQKTKNKIHYALIITIEAPKNKNLYNQIVQQYRTQLRPLTPVIQIPVRM